MKLEQSFEVQAPMEQVWEALIDLERVAPCLPGAAITGHDEDGTYHGTFKVKLGPTTASYRGTLPDRGRRRGEPHRATHAAPGAPTSAGRAARRRRSSTRCSEDDGGTRVDAVTDFTITGRLAQFGRGGMMQDISNRLLRDFAGCLQRAPPAPAEAAPEAAAQAPASPPAAKPVSGLRLFFGALWDRLRRLFGGRG